MKLVYWMYNGPAHLGTLRTATSFKNVHAIMHAPLGDDYFNVMRSMLERERDFTPVTASIVDRHVLARGSQEKVIENVIRKDKEESPDLILLTPTCTSSILQEDLQNFADQAGLEARADVLLADVNHYRVNEFQAADRTLEQIIHFYLAKCRLQSNNSERPGLKTKRPSANILGIFTLGFHHQHDCRELKRLLYECGIDVNIILPEGGSVLDIQKLPEAWFNIVPYREIGLMAAQYLEKEYSMPYVSIAPMGIFETASFLREIQAIIFSLSSFSKSAIDSDNLLRSNYVTENQSIHVVKTIPRSAIGEADIPNQGAAKQSMEDKSFDFEKYIALQTQFISEASWFSRSIDCQNLTGKKAFVFGDATHAAAMTKILAREMGIRVSCAGTYCKNDADWFREQVSNFCDTVLITDDHTQVAEKIALYEPAAIFGTQMERHIGKRLGIPCGVISAPVHIQNFSLGYRPFFGYEGTNQIADLVYNSFTLGMEDHLLEIFGGHDVCSAVISRSPVRVAKQTANEESINNPQVVHLDGLNEHIVSQTSPNIQNNQTIIWDEEALTELQRIPGFVRGKVKQNTEKYAQKKGFFKINLDIMYEAKEAVS